MADGRTGTGGFPAPRPWVTVGTAGPPTWSGRPPQTTSTASRPDSRFRSPHEQLLNVFDAQGQAFSDPAHNGCAFVRATAEAPENSSVRRTGEKYRAWLVGLFTELAAATGYAEPEGLARRLHLLYDGA